MFISLPSDKKIHSSRQDLEEEHAPHDSLCKWFSFLGWLIIRRLIFLTNGNSKKYFKKQMKYLYEEKIIEKGETILFIWKILFQEGNWHLFDISFDKNVVYKDNLLSQNLVLFVLFMFDT